MAIGTSTGFRYEDTFDFLVNHQADHKVALDPIGGVFPGDPKVYDDTSTVSQQLRDELEGKPTYNLLKRDETDMENNLKQEWENVPSIDEPLYRESSQKGKIPVINAQLTPDDTLKQATKPSEHDDPKSFEQTIRALGHIRTWPGSLEGLPKIQEFIKNLPEDIERVELNDHGKDHPDNTILLRIKNPPLTSDLGGKQYAQADTGTMSDATSDAPVEPRNPLKIDITKTKAPGEADRGVIDKLLGQTGERYQVWPEKMVRGMIEGFKLPGDVYSGKTDPSSDEAIGRAVELAGTVMFGPIPLVNKVVDGTLGIMAGVGSKTANREALAKAQTLERYKHPVDDIWKETGWYKGGDGRWKFEIPDTNIKMKLKESYMALTEYEKFTPSLSYTKMALGDVIDHPALFKAYPFLKSIPVEYQPGKKGASVVDGEKIVLGPGYVRPDVILHEIQHLVQAKEGFAQGGSGLIETKYLRYAKEVEEAKAELRRILDKYESKGFKPPENRKVMTPSELEYTEYATKLIDLDRKRLKVAKDISRENYRKLAGEVEARNVADRYIWWNSHKNVSPASTEDIARSSQVISKEPAFATPYGYATDWIELKNLLNNKSNKQ